MRFRNMMKLGSCLIVFLQMSARASYADKSSAAEQQIPEAYCDRDEECERLIKQARKDYSAGDNPGGAVQAAQTAFWRHPNFFTEAFHLFLLCNASKEKEKYPDYFNIAKRTYICKYSGWKQPATFSNAESALSLQLMSALKECLGIEADQSKDDCLSPEDANNVLKPAGAPASANATRSPALSQPLTASSALDLRPAKDSLKESSPKRLKTWQEALMGLGVILGTAGIVTGGVFIWREGQRRSPDWISTPSLGQ